VSDVLNCANTLLNEAEFVEENKESFLCLSRRILKKNLNNCTDVQTFWSVVAMQLYRTSNERLFPCFDEMTLYLTNKVLSFPPGGLGADKMSCVLFRTTDATNNMGLFGYYLR
jgi:hypothetical protein